MKSLFIFTNFYPFSTQECFLGDELSYLCQKFETVHLIPKYGKNTVKRQVPFNCYVHEPIDYYSNKARYYILGAFSFKTLPFLIRDFFQEKPYTSIKKNKNFIEAWFEFNNICHSSEIKSILRSMNNDDVMYFYWGVGWNKLALLTNKYIRKVSRFHGDWDLWEKSYDYYIPLRRSILRNLDAAISISSKGVEFLNHKYQVKSLLMPLGSYDKGACIQTSTNDYVSVVSCSTVYPLKRVQLIFDCLNSFTNRKIMWTHLGGGPDYEKLVNYVDSHKNSKMLVYMPGNVDHEEVLTYYKNNHVDCFVNLSTNEGVPVSIMEAASFDIPTVATNVGSTADVVSSEVGVLVSSDPTIGEVCDAIDRVLSNTYTPRMFWMNHYNADLNYSKFTNYLLSL